MARLGRANTRVPVTAPAGTSRSGAVNKLAILRKLAPLLAAAQRSKRGRRVARRTAR